MGEAIFWGLIGLGVGYTVGVWREMLRGAVWPKGVGDG